MRSFASRFSFRLVILKIFFWLWICENRVLFLNKSTYFCWKRLIAALLRDSLSTKLKRFWSRNFLELVIIRSVKTILALFHELFSAENGVDKQRHRRERIDKPRRFPNCLIEISKSRHFVAPYRIAWKIWIFFLDFSKNQVKCPLDWIDHGTASKNHFWREFGARPSRRLASPPLWRARNFHQKDLFLSKFQNRARFGSAPH